MTDTSVTLWYCSWACASRRLAALGKFREKAALILAESLPAEQAAGLSAEDRAFLASAERLKSVPAAEALELEHVAMRIMNDTLRRAFSLALLTPELDGIHREAWEFASTNRKFDIFNGEAFAHVRLLEVLNLPEDLRLQLLNIDADEEAEEARVLADEARGLAEEARGLADIWEPVDGWEPADAWEAGRWEVEEAERWEAEDALEPDGNIWG
jgi:hypothetical protein